MMAAVVSALFVVIYSLPFILSSKTSQPPVTQRLQGNSKWPNSMSSEKLIFQINSSSLIQGSSERDLSEDEPLETINEIVNKSCSAHKLCGNCILASPKCRWVLGSCQNAAYHSDAAATCPPVIRSFRPSSGPLEGGTEIIIHGHDFGYPYAGHPKVAFLMTDPQGKPYQCKVEKAENEKIICRTGNLSAENPFSSSLTVTARDDSRKVVSYTISGQDTSEGSFSFVKPKVEKIEPTYGFRSSSTEVVISGKNLAAGSRKNISVVDFNNKTLTECVDVISINNSQVSCTLMEYDGQEVTGFFELKIDDATIRTPFNFTFVSPDDSTKERIMMAAFCIWMFIIIAIVTMPIATIYYWSKTKVKKEASILRTSFVLSPLQVDYKQLNSLRAANKLIDKRHLHWGRQIGKGHFGMVYKGVLDRTGNESIQVAIKTLPEVKYYGELNSLICEALIMKDFDHPNVLSLVGLALPDDTFPLIVTRYMRNGDLLNFVRNDPLVPLVQLIKFTLDIALGMEYLALRNFVHRDLAARNCMLDDNLNVRVADFGLTRNVFKKGYYRSSDKRAIPHRWMPPESLKMWLFDEKTDVWSFAVTSWEVLTRGHEPYEQVIDFSLEKFIESGGRLEKPDLCPDVTYDLWMTCWSEKAEDRPKFTAIVNQISAHLSNLRKDTSIVKPVKPEISGGARPKVRPLNIKSQW